MNHWKILAVSALLFPAMTADNEVIDTPDALTSGPAGAVSGIDPGVNGFGGIEEREAASRWERIEIPRALKKSGIRLIRTGMDRRTPEHAQGFRPHRGGFF